MNRISVTIITKNEERNIARCLDSVRWADEIVVVDSGSEDRTKEICRQYNCVLHEATWLGFGKTKKLAVNLASHDWILSIDADEELTPKLINEIKELLKNGPEYQGYRIKRHSFYLGKRVRFCGWNRDYTLRLFNRKSGNFNDKSVHEYVVLNGKISRFKHPMLHYTYPDLSSHQRKIKLYAELSAENMFRAGKKSNLTDARCRAALKFLKMYILQMGFLDGKTGWLLSVNSARGVYWKYFLLWKKNNSTLST